MLLPRLPRLLLPFFLSFLSWLGWPSAYAAEPVVAYPANLPVVWPATVNRGIERAPSATPAGDSTTAGKKGASQGARASGMPTKKAPVTTTVSAILPRAVKPGELATVLPLKRGLPARDLPVKTVREQPAQGGFAGTWVIDVDASVAPFQSARPAAGAPSNQPFEAVVIYPATAQARVLARPSVANDLPNAPGASATTLWAAVDVTKDGKADVAIFRSCCERPTSPAHAAGAPPCQSECEQTYVRADGRPWQLVQAASDD